MSDVSPEASPSTGQLETPRYTIDDLTAPVDEAPDRRSVLDRFEPIGTEALVVIDFSVKTPDFSTPPGVDMETAVYDQAGYAAHLCAKGSLRETTRERSLEQQRGCLLAIADDWLQYLQAEDAELAEERFARARAVFGLASTTLDAKARRWLEATLRGRLPATRDEVVEFDPRSKAGKAKVKTLLARQTRKASGTSLLRAMRDAQAANLPYAIDSTEWPPSGMPSAVGWQVVDVKNGKVHHATRAGMCLHDLRYLEKVKWPIDVSGASFVFPPAYACWELTRQMWEAYRSTGAKEYRTAAEQAWAMLRKVSPVDAERIEKSAKFGKYERPLR
jgi:hypothetical protein